MGEIGNFVWIISSECACLLLSKVPSVKGDIGILANSNAQDHWLITTITLQGLQRLQKAVGMHFPLNPGGQASMLMKA